MCCELVFLKMFNFFLFQSRRTHCTHINRYLFVEIHLNLLPGYLDEVMWMDGGREAGREGQDKFEVILYEISTKCCSSIKQVKNWGSAILYTYVKNNTPRGVGVLFFT